MSAREETHDVRWGERGYGFFAGAQFFLVRCGECGRENYAPAVASGVCVWCGAAPAETLRAREAAP